MKDEIMDKIVLAQSFDEAKLIIDDYMDYYNNDRPQWQLAKLTPNEYYEYITTGIYPISNYTPGVSANGPPSLTEPERNAVKSVADGEKLKNNSVDIPSKE